MYSNESSSQSFFRKNPVIIAIFLLIQLIFVIFLIMSFMSVNNDGKSNTRNDVGEVTIDGLSGQVDGITGEVVSDIQKNLADAVFYNLENVNLSNVNAIIREGTMNRRDFEDFVALSFVVDLPSLEQSYQVYYNAPVGFKSELSANRNPKAVLCLDKYIDKIYSDFNCQSSYPVDTRRHIITDYVKFLSFDKFALTINSKYPNRINLTVYEENTSDEVKKTYVEQAKDAVTSLGVSPEIFEFQVLIQ